MFQVRKHKKLAQLAACLGIGASLLPPATEAEASCGPEDTVYLGSVCTTAINFCPRGYTEMAGQLLAITDFSAIFSLLGCTWGGDCRASFALPDMRGRSPIGTGTGPGLTKIELGQWRGAETHTLKTAELAQHNHVATFTPTPGPGVTGKLEAYTSRANSDAPVTGDFISGGGGAVTFGTGGLGAQLVELGGLTVSGGENSGGTVTVSNTGDARPFSIQDPVMALTYCIATEGLYPPRS